MIHHYFGSMVRTVERPNIKGVIFDMGSPCLKSVLIKDGTLCLPQNWMFGHMRAALGIDDKIDILTHIESLPTPEEQRIAHAKIEKVEEDAMNKMVLRSQRWSLILDCPGRSRIINEGMDLYVTLVDNCF